MEKKSNFLEQIISKDIDIKDAGGKEKDATAECSKKGKSIIKKF